MFVIVAPTHFELIRRAIQIIEIILVDSQLLWAVVALILYYCVIAVINFFIHMMCLLLRTLAGIFFSNNNTNVLFW